MLCRILGGYVFDLGNRVSWWVCVGTPSPHLVHAHETLSLQSKQLGQIFIHLTPPLTKVAGTEQAQASYSSTAKRASLG